MNGSTGAGTHDGGVERKPRGRIVLGDASSSPDSPISHPNPATRNSHIRARTGLARGMGKGPGVLRCESMKGSRRVITRIGYHSGNVPVISIQKGL